MVAEERDEPDAPLTLGRQWLSYMSSPSEERLMAVASLVELHAHSGGSDLDGFRIDGID